jgi:hypothetical protein
MLLNFFLLFFINVCNTLGCLLFQSSIMFVGKARSLLFSGAPERPGDNTLAYFASKILNKGFPA